MHCFRGHNTLGGVLFWDFTQRSMVVPCGRFGTKYLVPECLAIEDGIDSLSETSVRNYRTTMCEILK